MAQVKLRTKEMTGKRHSLYLDFYPAIPHPETGRPTRREFLGLYIYDKPKTEPDKEHNRETLKLAENIKAKRQLEVQAEHFDFLKKKIENVDFLKYFKELSEKQNESDAELYLSAWTYLNRFTGGSLMSSEIDESFCNDFKEFLNTTSSTRTQGSKEKMKLSENSKHTYFNKFRAALKQAFKAGIIKDDLFGKIKPIPQNKETHRNFLSQEELQALANTPCSLPILKQAALFSALTGLRFSDIKKMTWNEVRHSNKDGYYIQFKQKKTGGAEVLPISEQAVRILGERKAEDDSIFETLQYSAQTNTFLRNWVSAAGIKKDITFHSFRHTYATLLLSNKVDLYTVSKMLGHKQISTTQIYAKIIDATKRDAADKIKIEF